MSKKKRDESAESGTITMSREQYEQLRELAKQRANNTPENDDDEFIEDLDESISDVGDAIDEKDEGRWELDENPIIDRLRHELRRERLTADGTWARPRGVNPLVNRVGEHDILGLLRSHLTKNIAMANITRDEARQFTLDVVNEFIKLSAVKWREWDLDKAYRGWLVTMMRTQIFTHLTRPIGEGERKYRMQQKNPGLGYSERDSFMNGWDADRDLQFYNNNQKSKKNEEVLRT